MAEKLLERPLTVNVRDMINTLACNQASLFISCQKVQTEMSALVSSTLKHVRVVVNAAPAKIVLKLLRRCQISIAVEVDDSVATFPICHPMCSFAITAVQIDNATLHSKRSCR